MKKVLLTVLLVAMSANIVLAGSKYPKYDEELAKVRTVKNAQMKVINAEIKNTTQKIEDLEENTTIYSQDRNLKLDEYNAKLKELQGRKTRLTNQYNTEKERLQKLYKNNKYKAVK